VPCCSQRRVRRKGRSGQRLAGQSSVLHPRCMKVLQEPHVSELICLHCIARTGAHDGARQLRLDSAGSHTSGGCAAATDSSCGAGVDSACPQWQAMPIKLSDSAVPLSRRSSAPSACAPPPGGAFLSKTSTSRTALCRRSACSAGARRPARRRVRHEAEHGAVAVIRLGRLHAQEARVAHGGLDVHLVVLPPRAPRASAAQPA